MDPENLTTPLQHDYTDPTVELNVAQLREWLTNLPLMDVAETVRLVLGALGALNEQKLEAELRFECLEVYRTTAQRLFQTVDPLHLRQLALSKTQRQEAIDGVAQVFPSLASGYKLIVKMLHAEGGSECADPLLGKALNRALEQLTYGLLDSYRFYREIQPLLISESHIIYGVARHHGVLGVSLDPEDGTQNPVTTAMLYHASMLLSLTDTARLPEGEVRQLFDVLMQHADQCHIIPGGSWEGSGEGLFLVDLQGEQLPVACTQLESPSDIQDPYLLDATDALQAIRGQLAKTPAKVRMQSPEAMLLRRLLPADSAARRRREQRHKDGRYVELLFGLETVHAYIRRFSVQRGEDETSVDEGLPLCRVLDSSNSGMKLSWEEGGAGDASVGDLVGVLEGEGGQQTLLLAIIRSVHVHREGGMETGVQLMAGGLGAISCSVPEQPEADAVHALFMPADEQEQIAATLVAPKGLYEYGLAMLIDVGGREVSVRAGHRVFDSPVFDRFEFSAQ
ncbi:MAG: hypothetical protein OEU91_10405 [Gammaproteobacteria bacterium]|nr:hypothetical protein [Gammaproteobacteria bacterium]